MRVALAEDSVLLREALAQLLTAEGHDVVASVGDAGALLAWLATDRPDIVVVDVRLPPEYTDEGLRAALEIRERWPGLAVLVLSQHVERRNAARLVTGGRGGVGYLLKDRVMGVGDFLDQLARVADGGTALDPEVVRQLLVHASGRTRLAALTERELAVLDLMAQGCTNPTIGARLHVSASAVEKHVNAIFTKLDLRADEGYSPRVLAILAYLER